jgi:hypothetical protein
MQTLLQERDALSNQRETLGFTERAAVTERIASSTQQIADMLAEGKPPRQVRCGYNPNNRARKQKAIYAFVR